MAKDVTQEQRESSRHEDLNPKGSSEQAKQKKAFVAPKLSRIGSLPEVTGGFIGVFTP